MGRKTSHIWLFIAALLLQVFIFDNLVITPLLVVHVYPIFILSLPINIQPIKTLLLATLMGIALDIFAAGFGLYTITCVASAMCRGSLLKMMLGHREVIDGARPSPVSLERRGYYIFVSLFMALQMALFLGIEGFGLKSMNFVVSRYLISTALSTLFVLLLLRVGRGRI